jgi:hypothetical protein
MSDRADGISDLRQVRATFATADQMQDAVSKLSISGFDRAEISRPSPAGADNSLAAASQPASTEEDARQARTLGASTAGAAAALAAAGVTIATGGAAAPAVAAAVVAGGAAGGATFAAQGASNRLEQDERDTQAGLGELVLTVKAATDEKQAKAEAVLREAGATNIETIN